MTHCPEHFQNAERIVVCEQKIQTLARSEELLWAKLEKHVEEGERDGGFRDRLLLTEKKAIQNEIYITKNKSKIDDFPKHYIKGAVIGGVIGGIIGGLLGQITPEIFSWIFKVIVK